MPATGTSIEIGRGNPRVKKLYPYPYPPKPLPPIKGKGFGGVEVRVQGGMGGMEYPQGYHSRVAINNHIYLCPNTLTITPGSQQCQHSHPHGPHPSLTLTRTQHCHRRHLHQSRGQLGAWVSCGNRPQKETSASVSMYPLALLTSLVVVTV